MAMEEQAIRFKRVYGDMFTANEDTDKMLRSVQSLAKEFTKYGVAVEKTMEMAASAAASGKMGADLLAQVNQATRLAILGGVEQQQALETTISLTNAFGVAAEFGHLRVVPEGHLCGCGARGCFEQYASGNALLRHAREAIAASPELARNLLARGDGSVNGLTGTAVTDAAREGDPVALAAFNTTAQWLGAGIASLSVILDPRCVIIGGGVIDAGDILLKPTREAVARYMPFAGKHPYPEIISAALGNKAGLIGVSDLARR